MGRVTLTSATSLSRQELTERFDAVALENVKSRTGQGDSAPRFRLGPVFQIAVQGALATIPALAAAQARGALAVRLQIQPAGSTGAVSLGKRTINNQRA